MTQNVATQKAHGTEEMISSVPLVLLWLRFDMTPLD
jgi:hypothetical protein